MALQRQVAGKGCPARATVGTETRTAQWPANAGAVTEGARRWHSLAQAVGDDQASVEAAPHVDSEDNHCDGVHDAHPAPACMLLRSRLSKFQNFASLMRAYDQRAAAVSRTPGPTCEVENESGGSSG